MQRHDQQAKDAIGDDRQGWWPTMIEATAAARSSKPKNGPTQIELQRGTCCSSGRDVSSSSWGALPCSIQGNRFERRLGILYSQQNRNQGKAPVLPGPGLTLFKAGNGTRPMARGRCSDSRASASRRRHIGPWSGLSMAKVLATPPSETFRPNWSCHRRAAPSRLGE
jgi:hypothetical protein